MTGPAGITWHRSGATPWSTSDSRSSGVIAITASAARQTRERTIERSDSWGERRAARLTCQNGVTTRGIRRLRATRWAPRIAPANP
jgi:hypothetical protein